MRLPPNYPDLFWVLGMLYTLATYIILIIQSSVYMLHVIHCYTCMSGECCTLMPQIHVLIECPTVHPCIVPFSRYLLMSISWQLHSINCLFSSPSVWNISFIHTYWLYFNLHLHTLATDITWLFNNPSMWYYIIHKSYILSGCYKHSFMYCSIHQTFTHEY